MRAIVIRDSGAVERLDLADFAALQAACGGTVVRDGEEEHRDGETVESPSILTDEFSHLTMWCNEEAGLIGMKANPVATILVGWWGAIYPDGTPAMLLGDVVITGRTDREGRRTPLTEKDAQALELAAGRIIVIPSEIALEGAERTP